MYPFQRFPIHFRSIEPLCMLLPQTAYSLHPVLLRLFLHIFELYQTISGNYTLVHWRHFLWPHPSTLLRISHHFHTCHYSKFLLTGCYKIHYNLSYHFLALLDFHVHLYTHNSAHGYPTETNTIPYPYFVLYTLWKFLPKYRTLHFYPYNQLLLHHTSYIRYPKYKIHRDVLPSQSIF